MGLLHTVPDLRKRSAFDTFQGPDQTGHELNGYLTKVMVLQTRTSPIYASCKRISTGTFS